MQLLSQLKKVQYRFLKLRFGNQNCMACQSIVKVDSVVEVNENSLYTGECVYLSLLEYFHFKWQEQRETEVKNHLYNIYQF